MDCTAWIILLRNIPLRNIPLRIIPQGIIPQASPPFGKEGCPKVKSLFFLPPPPTGTPPSRRRRSYAGCLRNLNQQDKPFFTLVVKKTPRSTSTKSFACESQFFHAVFLKKRDVFLIISHWHPFYLLLMHFPYCAGRNAGHNFPYEKGDVLRI